MSKAWFTCKICGEKLETSECKGIIRLIYASYKLRKEHEKKHLNS